MSSGQSILLLRSSPHGINRPARNVARSGSTPIDQRGGVMRTFGVEEEFLLVDAETGYPVPLGQEAFGQCTDDRLTCEIKQEQIETGTRPHTDVNDLALDIARCRALADSAALRVGARAAALATSPQPAAPQASPGSRYEEMQDRFALTASEQLTCGCHVHVGVEDDDEGVAVLDRIRAWLPVLLALSSNSPYWNGTDTGYASYRSQAWSRWPMAGPCDVFGTAERYHATVSGLLDTAVPVDLGQIYFDARLSHHHPTVEVRVSDVCLYSDDAVLIALLTRGLVETAAREWRAGVAPLAVPTATVRMASWRAGRFGMDGKLLHPLDARPQDAASVALALLRYIRPALQDHGDAEIAESLLRQLLARGTGSRRQRAALLRRGDLGDVVSEAVRVTNLARGGIAEHHEVARRPARRSLVKTGGWGRASSS
ncbi:glutamate--cysteine ligase [Arthrobacter burdickii]|uniref:Putative glutamate--cysteine ligase 2 n=1 Tax=Arthrobacter burdickii TaxID=3035920 RepID=A0ABT8K5X0_9MICC|nr:glutamate--cysteine ligase [Arthrobacter burdickii]MDN4612784.1 glutamate--cysteine ligase [Arthrobacter burdickii]